MNVAYLFSKPTSGSGVRSQSHLKLLRGYGIEGDAHARVGNPRQVLMVSLSTLHAFDLQPGALRENLVLDRAVDSCTSGQVLQIGAQAAIRVMFSCEPCSLLNTIRPGLMRQIKGHRGVLGMVVQDGLIQVGDPVAIAPQSFPALSDIPKERFFEFVARIPVGKVVRTSDVILALGVLSSYYRAIPILMKKAPADLPVHRIVARDASLLPQHIPHQREALQAEGIELVNHQVSSRYFWNAIAFHDVG